jgi:hypothetical protein
MDLQGNMFLYFPINGILDGLVGEYVSIFPHKWYFKWTYGEIQTYISPQVVFWVYLWGNKMYNDLLL